MKTKRLQKIASILFLVIVSFLSKAQPCVDSSLIDPLAICPSVYNPVCGCDGVTYDNSCYATSLGGVTSYTQGPCSSISCIDSSLIDTNVVCFTVYDPVCGCNGITYSNSCIATVYGGVLSWTQGACSSVACVDTSLIDSLALCPFVYNPVCGCDGITYSNSCFALVLGGVTSYTQGACASICVVDSSLINDSLVICPSVYDPVCGCNGVTYGNACEAASFYGITNFTPGACTSTGIASPTNDLGLYLYPNPANDKLTIRLNKVTNCTVLVMDMQGKLVKQLKTNELQTELNVSDWANGIYFIRLTNDSSSVVRKISISK